MYYIHSGARNKLTGLCYDSVSRMIFLECSPVYERVLCVHTEMTNRCGVLNCLSRCSSLELP